MIHHLLDEPYWNEMDQRIEALMGDRKNASIAFCFRTKSFSYPNLVVNLASPHPHLYNDLGHQVSREELKRADLNLIKEALVSEINRYQHMYGEGVNLKGINNLEKLTLMLQFINEPTTKPESFFFNQLENGVFENWGQIMQIIIKSVIEGETVEEMKQIQKDECLKAEEKSHDSKTT